MATSFDAPSDTNLPQREQLLGHPTGLFTLFFAEMWERFSYYGMRALLVLYMMKGFLDYEDAEAYTVYGAYTALVYMTPFFGGLLADRVLGSRRAVVFGGLLMAAGHALMTQENPFFFYTALALLIVGNGFFKPNISTIVGTLYPANSPARDGGFTIFYMGVNLGAAMSPLLCGYIGETYGWHNGFGLATYGMLVGLAVFVLPTVVAQLCIAAAAIVAATCLFLYHPESLIPTIVNNFVAIALLAAAVIACIALSKGGLPRAAGAPPDVKKLKEPILGILSREWLIYLGTIIAIPVFVLFVSGFSFFTSDGKGVVLIPESTINLISNSAVRTIATEVSRPAGLVLFISGLLALAFLLVEIVRLNKIQRERMFVVLILTFFSMLFWAFFEQAGSSVNNFTDRNIDRVAEESRVAQSDVGKALSLSPTQEQLGYTNGDQLFTLSTLEDLRKEHSKDANTFTIDWQVSDDDVGMGIAERNREIPASTYQSVNPVCILLFGLVFTAAWGFLGRRGLEPSTPFKFAMGLLQLGLGFGVFWYGTQVADERGMVWMGWLIIGYILHTTGELCLSPVGLSMITKLSPKHLVSTTMGVWFLATAFSQFLAAIIAQFTGVTEGEGGQTIIPVPLDTVNVYGGVFRNIAGMAIVSSVICFLLVPLLKKWMHTSVVTDGEEAVTTGGH